MTDRVVRDELLTSERYWSVSIQAQQLYVHLILCVDDAARFSGKNFTIRSACYPGRAVESSDIERWLLELIDADMIRAYFVNDERFLFVPRFRNRRRYVASSKFPSPPNEINDLATQKSSLSQPQVIPESPPRQEERGRRGVGEKTTRASRTSQFPLGLESVSAEVRQDWIAMRKAKRAAVTPTAIRGIQREADKAGMTLESVLAMCCARGWTGFKAEWIEKSQGNHQADVFVGAK
jgi:hypothetical protein